MYLQIIGFHVRFRIGRDQDRGNAQCRRAVEIVNSIIDKYGFLSRDAAFVQSVKVDTFIGFEDADKTTECGER